MSVTIEEALGVPGGESRAEVERVAEDYEPAWYTSLNADQERPAWFLARREGTLIGFLTVFAPSGDAAEVSAFVAPEHRRQGVFTALWAAARRRWENPDRRWLLVVDRAKASGVAVAQRKGSLAFTESTLSLPAEDKPQFAGLPHGLTLVGATADDLEGAVAVHQAAQSGREDYRGFVEAVLADPQRRLVLLKEAGKIIAVAGLHVCLPRAEIFGLAVHPERQGRGWGRALVVALLDLGADGVDEFLLEVDSTNARAESLYRSLGFKDRSVTDYYEVR